MRDMPRPRKPYVHKETSRHGKVVWYFRRGKEKRTRLPGVFGSKEFNAAYDLAFAGKEAPPPPPAAPAASFRWLVEQYLASGRFERLRPNTQRNHRLMLTEVCKTGGNAPFRAVKTEDIAAGMVRRERTPRMSAIYLSVMRALFRFARDSGHMKADPTEGLVARKVESDGYHTWTVEEVEAFQARHPIGTQARLALDIMLYTGLRRSDAIVLGRQHIRGNILTIKTTKTRAEVTIPVHPMLRESIRRTSPIGQMVYLINSRGEPWKNNAFGYWFADRCDEAGVPGRAHGLRKAGATFAANNGATPQMLSAMYGWTSSKMAEVYTRKVDKVRLAAMAAELVSPHLEEGAGAGDEKARNSNGPAQDD